jgi:type III pantothenate kinase
LNLIIEQGNSATKVAVFNQGKIIHYSDYKNFNEEDLIQIFNQFPLKNGFFSTVIEPEQALITSLENRLERSLFFDGQVRLPVTVRYQTPETLGRDRIAVAVGANFLFPQKDILIIDAGTAITFDVVEAQGVYLGGNISPGMTTRFHALNRFTKRLPLVEEREDVPLLGTSTETAILAGVVRGIVYEMDGYIDELRNKYPCLYVFLTGGHAFYFEKRLKNTIFADKLLGLIGLHRILEYNVEKQ